MPQITKKTAAGADAGTVVLDESMFATRPNVPVMHQVVTAQLAARRAGTQSTKTRSEVRGGGAKPYRQKGTGNARQGSIRSPQFTGGGVALAPKPRSYAKKTPKKMIALALRSALSDRAADDKVVVVDEWGWDRPSTKQAKAALSRLGIDGKVLVVVDRDDAVAALSFRNLPEVQLIEPAELNAYDVLCNEWIVFTESVLPGATATPEAAAGEPGDDRPSTVEQVTEQVSDVVTDAASAVAGAASTAAGTVADAAGTVADAAASAVGTVADAVTTEDDDDQDDTGADAAVESAGDDPGSGVAEATETSDAEASAASGDVSDDVDDDESDEEDT